MTQPVISYTDGVWMLYDPYYWRQFRIPSGIRFDLHSVPKWVPRWIADDDDHTGAALIHDMLYRYRGDLPRAWDASDHGHYTRPEADRLYLEALKESGMGRLRRRIMYAAVRMAGRKAWEDNKVPV